ncbi:MAG: hypothetical protein ABH804_01280 [archaeon]
MNETILDMSFALQLAGHIKWPCDGKEDGIRKTYLTMEQHALQNEGWENPFARDFLQSVVNDYQIYP